LAEKKSAPQKKDHFYVEHLNLNRASVIDEIHEHDNYSFAVLSSPFRFHSTHDHFGLARI